MFGLELEVHVSENKTQGDLLIREWLEDVAQFMYDSFTKWIPVSSGATLAALEKGNVNKTIYGYSVEVGVGRVFKPRSFIYEFNEPNYPLFVHEGTGIYGERGGRIYASHGNVMAFEKEGEGTVFTRWVEGQHPQPYSEAVEEETDAYIELHKHDLAEAFNKLVLNAR